MPYSELEFVAAKNGQPSARIGGLNLHSAMDPGREAEKMAASPETEIADFVIVFGAGLGYLPGALLRKLPERPVLVVEPETDWFEQALGHIDSQVFRNPGVEVIKPRHRDDIVVRLQDAGSRNPVYIGNPAIQKLRPELSELCKEAVRIYRERFQVNVNTLRRFGRLWVKNLARNLDYLATAPGVAALENTLRNVPGVLVAGGPSLDSFVGNLRDIREHAVIVAVDTSLRACLRAGVDPDFVVTVDPQYWNTKHMDGCRKSRATVVSESAVFPRGLRQTEGTVLLCSSLFPLGQYFENLIETKGKLGAGGSVATTAWDFLRFLGCRDIYALGLDLSFPDAQTHFHGSVFEEASHRDGRRLRPSEQLRFDALRESYPTESDIGTPVLSDRRMDIYVHWFENQARIHPEVRTKRLGTGSRRIEGIGNANIEEILSFQPHRSKIDSVLATIAEISVERRRRQQSDLATLVEARSRLRNEMERLEQISSRGREQAAQARKLLAQNRSAAEILKDLDLLDNKLMDSSEQRVAGFLVEEVIQSLSTAAKPASFDEALARSEQLYGAIAEVCAYQKRLFA